MYVKLMEIGKFIAIAETDDDLVSLPFSAPPHILKNVSVTPSTILALVSWDMDKDGDGGYPIRNFQIAYRLKNGTENDWKTCFPAYIDPKTVSLEEEL
jgi:hypothetical protein